MGLKANGHIDGVVLTPLKQIECVGGNVYHALKNSDTSFNGFGEAYFSDVDYGVTKGWKLHKKMTMNLVVVIGSIQFFIFDERICSGTKDKLMDVTLSLDNYARLTVEPNLWVAFRGIGKERNSLLNVANMPHDPSEAERRPLDEIAFADAS